MVCPSNTRTGRRMFDVGFEPWGDPPTVRGRLQVTIGNQKSEVTFTRSTH